VPGAGTRKGIPEEEGRDFVYNSVPGDQAASIREGMKSEARVFSNLELPAGATPGLFDAPLDDVHVECGLPKEVGCKLT
jgi:hypothetical protein